MTNEDLAHLPRLTDTDLFARTRGLARAERRATAELVACLAELHRRDVVRREGYSCLFVYCRDALGMTGGEAYNRSAVAEAAARFPALCVALLEGDVSLTVARLVAPHLTADNHAGVLESVRGRTTSEVEVIVAALAPRPDARPLLRKLPPREALLTGTLPQPPAAVPAPPPPVVLRPPAPAVAPTAPDRYRLQVTIDGETAAVLRQLKDLLRHVVPSADEAEIVRRALAGLLSQVRKQKLGAAARPARKRRGVVDGSRHIPAHVKRAVWARDGGQCAFVSRGGRRCTERAFLEFHHRHPHALGGLPAVENVALRCRPHNIYEAEIDFGVGNKRVPATSANREPSFRNDGPPS
jgi:hypothetical protein